MIAKATFKRHHLTGGFLTVSEGKSSFIMERSIVAGMHGTGAVAKSSHDLQVAHTCMHAYAHTHTHEGGGRV